MDRKKAVLEKSPLAFLSANHRPGVAPQNLWVVLKLQGEVGKDAGALNLSTGLL
jgi:hypothetical protein